MNDQVLERGMPASIEAERSILGAVILDNAAMHEAAVLSPADFYLEAHHRLFRRMLELDASGKAIDIITLTEELRKTDSIEQVGGVSYISSLTDGLPRRPSIASYVDIVRDKSKRRRLIHSLNSSLAQAFEPTDSTRDCLATLEESLLRIEADCAQSELQPVGKFSINTMDELLRIKNSPTELIGLTTGMDLLDQETTGYRDGELAFIGGRPKQGKSSLMIQSATANASAGVPVALFSLELSKEDVLRRVWCIHSGVPYYRIRDPKRLSREDQDRLHHSMAAVADWPLFVYDKASATSHEIAAMTRLAVRRHGVRIAFVDYLQKIREKAKDERQSVTLSSERLRTLAKQENIPVVVLSQLRRPYNGDPNAIPTIFELKESGAVEADAHLVILTYRPIDKETQQPTGKDELIIGAQRNGPTGSIETSYNPANRTFGCRR